jgi:hypothetical protein
VRLQRGLVTVDLIEIETARVVAVLDDIKAKAARLVTFRMLRVVAGDVQEL